MRELMIRSVPDMCSSIPLLFALISPFFLSNVAAECNQFSTNGSTAARYDFYRFYDFRNLHISGDSPSISASSNGKSKIVAATPWSSGWDSKNWHRPAAKEDTLPMQYAPSELSISNNTDAPEQHSTYLTLHTTLLQDGTQLAAELDYTEYNVTYASMRMSARVHGARGAVAGFFTYHNDTNESDIEIMTGDPSSQVHYSNQPTTNPETDASIPDATFNVSMAADASTSTWNVYRLDWVSNRSAWYLNGAQSASTEVNVPGAESMLILNLWSNGGKFSGRMETGDEAWFDIQWVELLFNTTASASAPGGGTVCSAEHSPGSPVPSNASPFYCSWLYATYFWWLMGVVSVVCLNDCMC
ncbi:concanavalin A-like lectin/glucanase [Clathrospora elynae]|uniref:Concanavalin A-like lectin/glucanase n=1 Tax=Clathrospora elynae TaxID=706981 RepID=A0A6A5SIZ8_9PLEO|nr:concanavalin A-like lectin/glucanase [Clathrospora elynae]